MIQQVDDQARAHLPADEAHPGPLASGMDEQDFQFTARGLAGGEAGGDDAGTVEHQQVPGPQQVRQVAHDAMAEGSARDGHEPGGVTGLHRFLGDEVLGQVVIEEGGIHQGGNGWRWRRRRREFR